MMNNLFLILADLQAAIAARAARDRNLTVLPVAVWGRIGRIRARLERLIALWRAGMLPKPRPRRAPRAPRATTTCTDERPKSALPTAPAWLVVAVREAGAFGTQLEHFLSQAECVEFLAAVPQARRILRPLCRMLGIGVAVGRVRKTAAVWAVPNPAPVVALAGLVMGPGGRLIYV